MTLITIFYKYRLSKFFKISSIESKFDMLEMFYIQFINLKFLDAEPENLNHKFTVLNNASKLYDDLIKEYKKVYENEHKDDNNNCKRKYDPKSLKNSEYQPVKLETKSLSANDKFHL